MNAILSIFRKELIDAMRDRRTMLVVLLSSLLGVPLLLLIVSEVLSQVESQEESRVVLTVGIEHAPRLENYILRQGYQVNAAPAGYEAKLRSKELTRPVLLVPDDFDAQLAHGERATLEIVFDTSNTQAQYGVWPLRRLLEGFSQEGAAMQLTMRGVSAEILRLVEIRERHLSRPEERKVTVTAMLPFMLIMALVIGGMYAAIDTTAGERERGSLEPLMMNPVSGWQLALGKWGAVAVISSTVVVLTVMSFFPSQLLIRNEMLRAEFQFGVNEAACFLLILLPLAAALSALQVAIALTCKSYKEAQVRNQMLSLAVSMVPVVMTFNPGREPAWFAWMPILAQNLMMNHVLKGQAAGVAALAIALLVCVALTGLSLAYVARQMRRVVAV
jgi:sodium transport system permease protein